MAEIQCRTWSDNLVGVLVFGTWADGGVGIIVDWWYDTRTGLIRELRYTAEHRRRQEFWNVQWATQCLLELFGHPTGK